MSRQARRLAMLLGRVLALWVLLWALGWSVRHLIAKPVIRDGEAQAKQVPVTDTRISLFLPYVGVTTADMTLFVPQLAVAPTDNLVDTLEAAGNFGTLLQALTAAGLTDALERAGPFTIFAPTDAAFASCPRVRWISFCRTPRVSLPKSSCTICFRANSCRHRSRTA